MRTRPCRTTTSAAAALLAVLALPSCSDSSPAAAPAAGEDPAVVEPVEGSDVAKVTLSEDAVRHLRIETARTKAVPGSGARAARVMAPYSALVYDAEGAAWVFTSPAPRTYLRVPVTVERIDGDTLTLSRGPAAGTPVVTVGAAELVGAEAGIDGEE